MLQTFLEQSKNLKALYDTLGVKQVHSVLWGIDGVIENDKFLMKELWSNEDWSLNAGASLKNPNFAGIDIDHFKLNNIGVSVGYTPDIIFRPIEIHGIIANSIEDTFNLQFKPKFGIGISVKF